jgi:hypothetical protein
MVEPNTPRGEDTTLIPGRRRKHPVIMGALLGAVIGTMLVMAVTLLGGAEDWYLLGIGGTVDGALLGMVVGAARREHQTNQDRPRPRRPVRAICLWAAFGLCISLALAPMLEQSVPISAILGLAVGTVAGAIISSTRQSSTTSLE